MVKEVERVAPNLKIGKAVILETNSSNLLGVSLQVKRDDIGFWILDTDIRDAIHGFDYEGKYLGMVSTIGEDPKSVPSISDFIVLNDTIKVLTSLGDRVLVSFFSKANQKLKQIELPHNFYSFEQSSSGYWLYSGYNKMAGSHRLKKVGYNGQMQKEFLPNDDFGDRFLPFVEPSFFVGHDKIILREALRPEVFTLTQKGLELELRLDLGDFRAPDSYWFMDPLEGFERLNAQGFSTIGFIQETESHFLIEIQTQENNRSKKDILIRNNNSNKWIKIPVDEMTNGHFYNPIGIEGNKIIFISYAPFVKMNYPELELSATAEKTLKGIDESSNPIILYAEIPEF